MRVKVDNKGKVIWEIETNYIADEKKARELADKLTKEEEEKFNVYKHVVFGHYVVINEEEFNKMIPSKDNKDELKFEHPLWQTIYTKVNGGVKKC